MHLYILLSFAVLQGQDGQAEGSKYNAGYGASSSTASAARYVHASIVHEARLVLLPQYHYRFPDPALWLKVACLAAVLFETSLKQLMWPQTAGRWLRAEMSCLAILCLHFTAHCIVYRLHVCSWHEDGKSMQHWGMQPIMQQSQPQQCVPGMLGR